MTDSLFHHVPKGDLRPGSAVDVDPPWAAFDVVHRMDYERLRDAATAFVRTTNYWEQRKASRPEFEALVHELLKAGAFEE